MPSNKKSNKKILSDSGVLSNKQTQYIVALGFIITSLSLISLLVNSYIYKFPSNNYFPSEILIMYCATPLFYWGAYLYFGKNSKATQSGKGLFIFIVVFSIMALATNASQLTPFLPIDKYIIRFESHWSFSLTDIMAFTYQHPLLQQILALIYDSLTYQMALLPLLLIAMNQHSILKDYYFLMLVTTLIGLTFYYFFPTTAPASMLNSPYFTAYQKATELKFNQIHSYIPPTTIEGGLVALPSYHTIWAVICNYLLKPWPIFCVVLSTINTLLILSCVMLGWHYVSDIIMGLCVVGVAFYWLRCCQ